MAGLKTALTLEEEKRKKTEVKIIEERRQVAKAVEQAILSFKSLEKLKNIKDCSSPDDLKFVCREHKAKVGHLSTEVGHLQETLKRKEQAMAGLKTALTLEEEKRKKTEVKIIEERRQVAKAVEQAILSFKSLEKLKNIKVESSKDEVELPAGRVDLSEAKPITAEPAERTPTPAEEPTPTEATPSSSTAPPSQNPVCDHCYEIQSYVEAMQLPWAIPLKAVIKDLKKKVHQANKKLKKAEDELQSQRKTIQRPQSRSIAFVRHPNSSSKNTPLRSIILVKSLSRLKSMLAKSLSL
ncbi:hypothetical protein COCNU_scaffold010320G000010 [Cocos nucifera]|nr:hypothetical protein [Cocos nucifera]